MNKCIYSKMWLIHNGLLLHDFLYPRHIERVKNNTNWTSIMIPGFHAQHIIASKHIVHTKIIITDVIDLTYMVQMITRARIRLVKTPLNIWPRNVQKDNLGGVSTFEKSKISSCKEFRQICIDMFFKVGWIQILNVAYHFETFFSACTNGDDGKRELSSKWAIITHIIWTEGH